MELMQWWAMGLHVTQILNVVETWEEELCQLTVERLSQGIENLEMVERVAQKPADEVSILWCRLVDMQVESSL